LKIDIEGADALCLEDLDVNNLPKFVSVEAECDVNEAELSKEQYLSNLNHLHLLGYNCFKLVSQHSLVPVSRSNLDHVLDPGYRRRMREQIERESNWRFAEGSSGPWGNEIPGPWMNYSEAAEVYSTCREILSRQGTATFWYWFDWHATTI